jgi:peptide/nickel transport system substrate-binding protein
MKSGNELPTVEAPDPYTVLFRFATPYGAFPRALAFQGVQHDLFLPRHYVGKHHPSFVPKAEMDEQVRKAGMRHWSEYFLWLIDGDKNVDLPVIAPFKIKVPYPAARCIAERNPYYYKVDPVGRQLPYIDELAYSMVFDTTVLNLKAMNGEADFQLRRIDPANFTMFREQGPSKGYQVRVTPSTNCTCVYLNQYSRDEQLRPILQDRRFRRALAYAINRHELIELIFSGLAEPSGGFTSRQDAYYIEGLDLANAEYNPALANQLLDEMGLVRGPDGKRLMPDGKPFTQLLHVYPSEEGSNPNLWQLVSDYWREIGLQFVVKQEDATLSFLQVTAGNSDFWTYTNPGFHWDIEGLWKAPIAIMSYMAPIHGSYYWSNGTRGVPPPEPLQHLVDWYLEMRSTADPARRMQLGKDILRQWADECYVVGICRPPIVAIVSDRFHNVPEQVNYDYRVKSPGYLGIEQFFIDERKPAQ